VSLLLGREFPLTLAPTGMVPTRESSPHVPLTPRELARDLLECVDLGITTVHIHARDEDGRPDWRNDTYARFVGAAKEAVPDIVVNVSTSGRNWSDLERRADCLALAGDLKPDMASLTLSSLNFMSGASVNEPQMVRSLAQVMLERGIVPELEVFDLGMVNAIKVLQKESLLPENVFVNLFLGNIYGAQATLMELAVMVGGLPDGALWSGAGLGSSQRQAMALALAAGGGVRIGLEDNLFLDRVHGSLATNRDLVQLVHEVSGTLKRSVMSPTVFRSLLEGAVT